jgi:hypothetical protein
LLRLSFRLDFEIPEVRYDTTLTDSY